MKTGFAAAICISALWMGTTVFAQVPTVTPLPVAEARLLTSAVPIASPQATATATATASATPSPTSTPQCPSSPKAPQLAGTLREGATKLSGVGDTFQTTCTALIKLYDVAPSPPMLLATSNSSVQGSDGSFSVTLSEPLREGQKIAVVESFNGTDVPSSIPTTGIDVIVPGDWGRVKAYFTSGILISQNQQSFSQSSLFMSFTIDKSWALPRYYHRTKAEKSKGTNGNKNQARLQTLKPEEGQLVSASRGPAETAEDWEEQAQGAPPQSTPTPAPSPTPRLTRGPWWRPGVNTFFDVRLTQIPVTACSSGGSSSSSNQSSPCTSPAATPSPSPGATPSATPNLETFLSSQKTARLAVGIYFPFTFTTWNYNKIPNALFVGPLAKVGFDTPAGSLNQTQPASVSGGATTTNTGTVTAVNQTNFYNFYTFGARIGHYALTSSSDRAPDLVSYIDVTFGPFSNLETGFVPKGTAVTPTTPLMEKRLYRVNIEGILKIPTTPLIVGLSANVGQEAVGTGGITIVQRAGDDLRFLFGVKFDVAKLLSKVTGAAP